MTSTLDARQLLDPGVIQDPYPFYRQLQREAPVWAVPNTSVFVASSLAMVSEVSGRVADFSNNIRTLLYRDDQGLPQQLSLGDFGVQTLATADPPDHALHRGAVFPELVARRMTSLEPAISGVATACVSRALDEGSTDFMATVANVVPITMITQLIGFQDGNLEDLLQAAFDSTEMLGATFCLARLGELIEGIAPIETWIRAQIEAAAAEPGDDLLGTVARAIADGVFGIQEGTLILHTLLSAGGESTTSLIGSAARLLSEHPHLQARLRSAPELIPAFVEESLRLETPFRHQLRSVPRDTTLGGVTIPAGSTVIPFWGAANRDPDGRDHPDDIDLERRILKGHVAFGRGIHHCVGAPLARLEADVVLRALLDRTSSITLDESRPPVWVDSLLVRRHQHLHLHLAPK
jgi:cytochrome P450